MPVFEGANNRMDPRNFSRSKLPRYSTHFSSDLRPKARVWGSIERYVRPGSNPSALPVRAKRKQFQYNPAEVAYSLNASQASPGSDFSPGSINRSLIVGSASFSLSLFFEREREVALYSKSPAAGGPDAAVPPHKGVLVDIDDLYDLLLDQQAGQTAGAIVPSTPIDVDDAGSGAASGQQSINITDASLNQFWGTVFISLPVLIRFSPALNFAGFATDMQITFNKFSSQLVPTFATVQMGFNIVSATTADAGIAAIAALGGTPTTGSATTPFTNSAAPGGVASGSGPTSAGGV